MAKENQYEDVWKQLKEDMKEGYLSKAEEELINNLEKSFKELEELNEQKDKRISNLKKEIKNLSKQIQGFLEKSDIPQPKHKKKISGKRLRRIIERKVGNAQVWLGDRYYYAISVTELKRFLKENKVNLNKYRSVVYDCDNFASDLFNEASEWCRSLTLGELWGRNKEGIGHAINFFVDKKEQFWVIEPQTDKIYRLNNYMNSVWLVKCN